MVFREAFRHWANKPTRREIREKEEKNRLSLAKANEESAQVRQLKKQIALLEDLLDKSYNQINNLSEVVNNQKQGDAMDRLIDKGLDIAENLFLPKKTINISPKKSPQSSEASISQNQTQIESSSDIKASDGYPYNSEQIKELVDSFPAEQIIRASKAPYPLFSKLLKKNYPQASNENILEAYNRVIERAENGK